MYETQEFVLNQMDILTWRGLPWQHNQPFIMPHQSMGYTTTYSTHAVACTGVWMVASSDIMYVFRAYMYCMYIYSTYKHCLGHMTVTCSSCDQPPWHQVLPTLQEQEVLCVFLLQVMRAGHTEPHSKVHLKHAWTWRRRWIHSLRHRSQSKPIQPW